MFIFPIRKENGFHTVSLLDNDNKEYIVNNNTKFVNGVNKEINKTKVKKGM